MGKHREIKDQGSASRGRSGRGSRLAFALALTALLLGAFVSFGGLAYAATQTRDAVHTITKVTTGHRVVVRDSSAADQYNHKKPKSCKDRGLTAVGSAHAKKCPQVFTPPAGQPASSGSGTTVSQTGTLPFTGLSLAGTALVSGLLLLLGIVLRRRERRSS
jgi:hypothetical protein